MIQFCFNTPFLICIGGWIRQAILDGRGRFLIRQHYFWIVEIYEENVSSRQVPKVETSEPSRSSGLCMVFADKLPWPTENPISFPKSIQKLGITHITSSSQATHDWNLRSQISHTGAGPQ